MLQLSSISPLFSVHLPHHLFLLATRLDSFVSFSDLSFHLFLPGGSCQILLCFAEHQCQQWSLSPLRNLSKPSPPVGCFLPQLLPAPVLPLPVLTSPLLSTLKILSPNAFLWDSGPHFPPHPHQESPSLILGVKLDQRMRYQQSLSGFTRIFFHPRLHFRLLALQTLQPLLSLISSYSPT